MNLDIIGRIHTDFPEKFGIPRQSGLIKNAKGKIIFRKEYRDINAVRGLEGFSHIWILWEFSRAKRDDWSPTVRPPLLGGNTKLGVFATRSPFRPNPIGMSLVELEKIENTDIGPVLHVKGADILDGTPIYDIKPYLPYADAVPEAKAGFTENLKERMLEIKINSKLNEADIPEEIIEILKGDPRPSYQDDKDRVYGMKYGEYEIKFMVADGVLTIENIEKE